MKEVIRVLVNTFSYIGLLCFIITMILAAFVLQDILYEHLIQRTEYKHPEYVRYITIGGFIFFLFIVQAIGYPLYKKYIHIKK
jgi:hypothetical protein